MSDLKQVKVDNWGIYFLQRLKHFFNRTDYCDLTLQFQDNAQLKVHRLVLNGCTEYFELLERTCEMYEDCLVMPDDLQADVVVPIVNFMYTGQLEFRMDMLEKLYQTSLVMNMPVLTKLLGAHRMQRVKAPSLSYCGPKRSSKSTSLTKSTYQPSHLLSSGTKRSYGKAFENTNTSYKEKKMVVISKPEPIKVSNFIHAPSPPPEPVISKKQNMFVDPRPTRYELPEELDTDNIFENSFTSISYTSKPLMTHPETTKQYPAKKSSLFYDTLNSKRGNNRTSTMNIVECKNITKSNMYDYDNMGDVSEDSIFTPSYSKNESHKDTNQLFDQILDNNDGPKVTIESKDKQLNNIDHAKIISEVLKKYPHLMKSNKSIKLKTFNTSVKNEKTKPQHIEEKDKSKDYTYYETDVLDSKEAAKLIAMGAENITGPWICLICGTPGRALQFTSYYKFRRHLVEVHNEKPVSKICEYCGFKSFKRNYMLHHLYTKHGVDPPPHFNFPKCNLCNYVALTEGFLIKHKLSHSDGKSFRCNVCSASFSTTNLLLAHTQKTGHKYSADKKANLHCIYCYKIFLRETNLYAHLKTNHKEVAKRGGIIEDSDEEKSQEEKRKMHGIVKSESYDNDDDGDVQYQIQQRPDGNIHVVSKKTRTPIHIQKQKILNDGFSAPVLKTQKPKPIQNVPSHIEYSQENIQSPQNVMNEENILVIDNNEYIMRDNQLIPRKSKVVDSKYILPDMIDTDAEQTLDTITPSTSIQYTDIQNTENIQQSKMMLKKSNISQPIQIVVSNEEEYKALMSSNHSIIFDGDANKTLTVLAAPHNATIDTTTIDMDNTQSNDMMIIQDDYPLNVSEAVATDNSNIVVVYSHQMRHVDDSDKQYQIITPQDIEAQYVQSSAVITQNYETVTTSTPVMSAHVIDAQVEESWENNSVQNIQKEQIQETTGTTLQTIVQANPISSQNEMSTNTTLIDLPEVQLLPAPKEIPAQMSEINNALTHANIMDIQNVVQKEHIAQTQQLVAEENQTTPTTSIDNIVNNPPEVITENQIQNTDTLNISSDEIVEEVQKDNIIECQEPSEATVPSLIQQNSDVLDNSPDTVNEANKIQDEQSIENISPLTHNANVIVGEQDEVNESSDNAEIVPSNESNPATSFAAKEDIENLASEWSEDEYEVQEPTNVIENNAISATDNIDVDAEGTTAEIEESIENIQQEMDKQIAESTVTVPNTEEEINTSSQEAVIENGHSSQDNHLKADVSISAIDNTGEGQEKLTSLLNDWEDNDSQEENDPSIANECEQDNVEQAVLSENTVNIETVPEENIETKTDKSDPNKDHNIKSLVSDWDDDDEENKD